MSVISLIDRLNEKKESKTIRLKNYYIDDVEVSALNFIFMYQDIKVENFSQLIVNSLMRPLTFCSNLYVGGVYSPNQLCPWGNGEHISKIHGHRNPILFLTDEQHNFYLNNCENFNGDVEFFRDCLNVYIQGFLDEFNGMHNLPFNFGISKTQAKKNALKNGKYGVLEVISKTTINNLNLGFSGVGENVGTCNPIYFQNQK